MFQSQYLILLPVETISLSRWSRDPWLGQVVSFKLMGCSWLTLLVRIASPKPFEPLRITVGDNTQCVPVYEPWFQRVVYAAKACMLTNWWQNTAKYLSLSQYPQQSCTYPIYCHVRTPGAHDSVVPSSFSGSCIDISSDLRLGFVILERTKCEPSHNSQK